MPVDLATAAAIMKMVGTVVKTANDFGWIDQLRKLFSKTHQVLILGSSGAGKSQLLTALKDILPEAISGYARTQLRENVEVLISSKFFNFIDTPGHGGPPGHLDEEAGATKARTETIQQAFGKPLAGVINVVSYGYHEKQPPAPEGAIDAKGGVSDDFLKANRDREIEALKEWVGMFQHPNSPTRLITVITKADLWWSEKKKVRRHYTSGEYFKALGFAKTHEHVVVEFASVRHRFYGVGLMDATFEDDQRAELRALLLHYLLLLSKPH